MKKLVLMCTLGLGVFAVGMEIRADRAAANLVILAPDLPPPSCWPDCPPDPQKTLR